MSSLHPRDSRAQVTSHQEPNGSSKASPDVQGRLSEAQPLSPFAQRDGAPAAAGPFGDELRLGEADDGSSAHGALLSCPFCGSANIDPEGWASHNPATGENRTGPACDDCGASADSVQRWNQRHLPAEVERLVVAARNVAFDLSPPEEALSELDEASEAFAAAVPWDNEPAA